MGISLKEAFLQGFNPKHSKKGMEIKREENQARLLQTGNSLKTADKELQILNQSDVDFGFENAGGESSRIQGEINNNKNSTETTQKKHDDIGSKISTAQENVQKFSDAIGKLEQPKKGSGEGADEQYDKDMQVYEQKLKELQSELEKAKSEVENLQKEQGITKGQLDQLKSTGENLQKELDQIKQKEGELANSKFERSESQTKLTDNEETYNKRDINFLGEHDNKNGNIADNPLLKDSIALEGDQMTEVLKAVKMDSNVAEVRGDHVLLKDGTFGKVSVTQNGDVTFVKTDMKSGKSKIYDLTNMSAKVSDGARKTNATSDDKTTNPMADSFKETSAEDKTRNYSVVEEKTGMNKNPKYVSLSNECDKLSDELNKVDKNKEPEKWQKLNDELYQKRSLQTTMLNYGVAKYEGKDSYFDAGENKEVDFKTGKPVEQNKTIEIKQKGTNQTDKANKTDKTDKPQKKKISEFSQPDQLKLLNQEAYRLGKEIDNLKKEDFATDADYEKTKKTLKSRKKQIEQKFDKLKDNISDISPSKTPNPKAKYDTYKNAMKQAEAERKEIVQKSRADYPNDAEYEKAERKRDELGKLIETYGSIADKIKTTYDFSGSFDE